MKVFVTGGAGYIGSHTIISLIEAGHLVVVADNLTNSSDESLKRIEKILDQTIPFYKIDIRDKESLKDIFSSHNFDAIIHFAGYKSVGESVAHPLKYYDNNLNSTIALLETMREFGVKKIIFSSSATVYGTPETLPITEANRVGVGITNPYGQTKFFCEEILKDFSNAESNFEVCILRYFNPIGAHKSGTIGEDPREIPNNLLPYISQVAVGKLEKLRVFGDDYNTPDGTGVRDYIHVVDLAAGHVAALEHSKSGVSIYNLGTGKGTSVFELISAFENASHKKIPYEVVNRRPGDIASCYASAEKSLIELGWKAQKTIEEACADSWRWQSQNPNGYTN